MVNQYMVEPNKTQNFKKKKKSLSKGYYHNISDYNAMENL